MPIDNPIYNFLKDAKGVIHVGASTGQERDIYESYGIPVIWIEAGKEEYEWLRRNLEDFPQQYAINALVGKKDGEEVTFYKANNSYSNSIFKLLKHTEVWPDVHMIDSEPRVTSTLETVLEKYDLSKFDTLILDVQGAELLVLEGAKKILPYFKYIRCEASDIELYEGQCLDHNLDRYLLQAGFIRHTTWSMAESTPQRGLYEILYQSFRTVKNAEIDDTAVSGNKVNWKVAVIISEPRLGFSVNKSVMHNAFGARNFPICKVQSAFWEQSMQNAFNNAIRIGADILITLDYDSIYSKEDVDALLLMACRYPEADIVTSWQLKRHDGPPTVLLGWKDEEGGFTAKVPDSVVTEEVTKVDHCVFGLTLIKVDKLLKMPKPWFQSFPNAEGEWEDGKIDADSYFFTKWIDNGFTIYSANMVKIGHLDEVVLWIDDTFQPVRQSLTAYYREGRPF